MSSTEASATSASPTRPFFEQGYSCGEALLLASKLEDGRTRDTLLRCIRGLSGGRAVTCTLLIAGLLALAERHAPPSRAPRPHSEWLDAFDAPGAPGSPESRPAPQVAEFKARFDARAMHRHGGLSCFLISDVDWNGGRPAGLKGTFPPDDCVRMADAVLEDLNELLGNG
ncbi:MAG: hypothetical protein FJ313_04095 [Gemmatimonadetes bacterium]|nr:hypothetical protein [Gemmatimonadota bacterium]